MRLRAEFWVKAYIRRCAVEGASAVVVRHGDDDAGAIFIKVDRLDGTCLVFGPAPAGLDGADSDRRWVTGRAGSAAPMPMLSMKSFWFMSCAMTSLICPL